MKDLHCHLLPGIDDGCSNIEESISLLKKMSDQGIKEIILTPHYIENSKYNCNNDDKKKLYSNLVKRVKKEKIDITLYLGNEVFFTSNFVDLVKKKEISTLNGSKYDYVLADVPCSGLGVIRRKPDIKWNTKQEDIDELMTKYELGHEEQERIKIWLQGYSGEPDQLLEKAGSILSELTNCVAVSSAPSDSEALIKRVELVPLSSKTAMVVLLASSGILKSMVVRTDSEITTQIAEVFYNIMQTYFLGNSVNNIDIP